MNWRVKSVLQRVIGMAPCAPQLNYLMQRRLGGLRDFPRECESKIDDWQIMARHITSAGVSVQGATLFEIGTGWYPTLPLCSFIGGAARVITADLSRLLRADLTLRCAQQLGNHVAAIAEATGCAREAASAAQAGLLKKLAEGSGLDEASGGAIRYLAPADATQTGLADSSVDIVFSNSVLEHVPEPVVRKLMTESYRILRPGGIMFHSVNCGDHYAYFDSSVNPLNYLRYSEKSWSVWNTDLLYQNRLRARDFISMAHAPGFEILLDTSKPTERRLKELQTVPVSSCFQTYSPEELCITSVDFIAQKEGTYGLRTPSQAARALREGGEHEASAPALDRGRGACCSPGA
jgi:SAM-dependent methyltransferase